MKKVYLIRPTSDKGCVWEAELYFRGFDNLPEHARYGELIEDGKYPYLVYWPWLDFVTCPIYPDEIRIEAVA